MSTVALFYLYFYFFFFVALYKFSFVFDNFHLCCIKIRSNIARLVCHTIMVSTSITRREFYFSAIWELLPFVPICNVLIMAGGGGGNNLGPVRIRYYRKKRRYLHLVLHRL